MLATIAILLVGCFVVCTAVLALAFVTDGTRKPSVPLAAVRSRRGESPQRWRRL